MLSAMEGDDPAVARVLDFWFGTLDADGAATPHTQKRWWMKDAAFDREIRAAFADEHARVVQGAREAWLATSRGRLAYVIVLDQFSRNMFRDTPDAFVHDAQALRAAADGIARGDDLALRAAERGFLYLPFMHSEDLAVQERGIEAWTRWRDSASGGARKSAEGGLDFARRHRDIVARFGRFLHRNAILGRASTPEEVEFLKEPGSSF
jgi:uncharacterized protein (DUF924 family)